jgi:uncharacterized protein
MNSRKVVDDFLSQKKIAVVGVSRTKTKFGNAIYKELKQKGYDVYAVNPHISTFNDDPCYADLLSLPEKVDAAIICIPPTQTAAVVTLAKEAGITKSGCSKALNQKPQKNFAKKMELTMSQMNVF